MRAPFAMTDKASGIRQEAWRTARVRSLPIPGIPMIQSIKRYWRLLRAVTGDDAYERYLAHWKNCHAREGSAPMSRKAFYEAEVQRRWNGIKRCC